MMAFLVKKLIISIVLYTDTGIYKSFIDYVQPGCGKKSSLLNENGPQSLINLNAWSSFGEAVWEGLEGVVLEEVWH